MLNLLNHLSTPVHFYLSDEAWERLGVPISFCHLLATLLREAFRLLVVKASPTPAFRGPMVWEATVSYDDVSFLWLLVGKVRRRGSARRSSTSLIAPEVREHCAEHTGSPLLLWCDPRCSRFFPSSRNAEAGAHVYAERSFWENPGTL